MHGAGAFSTVRYLYVLLVPSLGLVIRIAGIGTGHAGTCSHRNALSTRCAMHVCSSTLPYPTSRTLERTLELEGEACKECKRQGIGVSRRVRLQFVCID